MRNCVLLMSVRTRLIKYTFETTHIFPNGFLYFISHQLEILIIIILVHNMSTYVILKFSSKCKTSTNKYGRSFLNGTFYTLVTL